MARSWWHRDSLCVRGAYRGQPRLQARWWSHRVRGIWWFDCWRKQISIFPINFVCDENTFNYPDPKTFHHNFISTTNWFVRLNHFLRYHGDDKSSNSAPLKLILIGVTFGFVVMICVSIYMWKKLQTEHALLEKDKGSLKEVRGPGWTEWRLLHDPFLDPSLVIPSICFKLRDLTSIPPLLEIYFHITMRVLH